jgi:hypothetical protein
MPDYDFRGLSSADFEVLVRDLLYSACGVPVESFSAGPDDGIDLRFNDPHVGATVVQCKHYAIAGFASLERNLKSSEAPKIKRLGTSYAQYIIATSVSMTPKRKQKIALLLSRHFAGEVKILGCEDLNGLLATHSDVERRHIKLWLANEAILSRVLHAAIWNDSEAAYDLIKKRMQRYVPNPSLYRARLLLDRFHYCIIAGIPGIGKSTLAEVLAFEHAKFHGFELIRISNNLSEIKAVADPAKKQLFYFDDFLGKTTLDRLEKNEDQRLVEFLQQTAYSRNWRFLLTTREYILRNAQDRHETLHHAPIDIARCTILLQDYTRLIRAQILYTHVYFAPIPVDHKLALLKDDQYLLVVEHHNYNPRVIEFMTDPFLLGDIAPEEYVAAFVRNLNNPEIIWLHAFDR